MISRLVGGFLAACSLTACVAVPGYRDVGLQRTVLPGLGTTGEGGIEAAFARTVSWQPPAAAGLVWLAEEREPVADSQLAAAFTGYERTGLLNAAKTAFRGDVFRVVGELPMIELSDPRHAGHPAHGEAPRVLDQVRAGCANFHFDVAVATSAELLAIDVRTGIPLAFGRGRDASIRLGIGPLDRPDAKMAAKRVAVMSTSIAATTRRR